MTSSVIPKGLGILCAILCILIFSKESTSAVGAMQQGALLAVLGYVVGFAVGQIIVVFLFLRQKETKKPLSDFEDQKIQEK